MVLMLVAMMASVECMVNDSVDIGAIAVIT